MSTSVNSRKARYMFQEAGVSGRIHVETKLPISQLYVIALQGELKKIKNPVKWQKAEIKLVEHTAYCHFAEKNWYIDRVGKDCTIEEIQEKLNKKLQDFEAGEPIKAKKIAGDGFFNIRKSTKEELSDIFDALRKPGAPDLDKAIKKAKKVKNLAGDLK